MTRTILLAAAVVASLGVGCTPPFSVESSTDVSVPGEGVLGGNPLLAEDVFPTGLIADALAQSIEQSFDTSGYDKGAVKSLTFTKLTLTVTNPEERNGRQLKDLSFFEELVVFLGAPGGEPIKVAESGEGDFKANLLTYDVPMTEAELAEAFKSSDALDMTAEVAAVPPQFATDIRIDSELTVQLGL